MSKCPFSNGLQKNNSSNNEPINDFSLQIFRLHPEGVRIENAHHKLKNLANKDALKWCGPYLVANSFGFWIYSPIDMEFLLSDNGQWSSSGIEEYENSENLVLKSVLKEDDKYNHTGRQKINFGLSEPDAVQIWTGIILKTPKDWCILVRDPINMGIDRPFRIQEGVIESDWMPYDIWINIKVIKRNEIIKISKNDPVPLCQFIPVKRESLGKLKIEENFINDNTDASNKMLEEWKEYNYQKWIKNDNIKDSSTFHRYKKSFMNESKNEK